MTVGYSQRSLVEKLGIRDGARIAVLGASEGYMESLGRLPERVVLSEGLTGPLDFIHFFTKSRAILAQEMPMLLGALAQNGALSVSWPKGSSKVATDLNANVVREVGLSNRLVDVKVAAIDEVWSGLKFVIRLEDRRGLK